MSLEKIEKIGKISKTGETLQLPVSMMFRRSKDWLPIKSISITSPRQNAEKTAAIVPEKVEPISKPSLMDEVRNLNQKVDRFSKVSPRELVAQADEVINQIETIKQKLTTPNLEIKPATQTFCKTNWPTSMKTYGWHSLKQAWNITPGEHLDNKKVNPIERFLGFLTHAQ